MHLQNCIVWLNFNEIYTHWSNLGLDNGWAPNGRQAIIWTSDVYFTDLSFLKLEYFSSTMFLDKFWKAQFLKYWIFSAWNGFNQMNVQSTLMPMALVATVPRTHAFLSVYGLNTLRPESHDCRRHLEAFEWSYIFIPISLIFLGCSWWDVKIYSVNCLAPSRRQTFT